MWVDKYAPITWAGFVGNDAATRQCKQWVQHFKTLLLATETLPSDRVLLLSGPEGVGKTSAAMLLLTTAGFDVNRFTMQEIRNHKKDTDLLSNFCHLYQSRSMTQMLGVGRRPSIVIDDFESLTKSDKDFHTTLVNLIKSGGGHSPPIILTTTTLPNISDKRRTQSYQGLAKIATEIIFDNIAADELERLIDHIAVSEGISIGDKVSRLIADYALGDARRAIMSFEMLARSKTHVTNELALDWVDQNSVALDEKVVFETEDITSVSSDEDKIIWNALTKTGRKGLAATNIILDNSGQFTPLLFQFYTKVASMDTVALIADEFSLADVVRENSWICLDETETSEAAVVTFSVDFPLRRMKRLKGLKNVTTNGYQTFYGVENTMRSQVTIAKTLRTMHPDLFNTCAYGLTMFQCCVADWLENCSDEELITKLRVYDFHPDNLDVLGRLKGNSGLEFKVSKQRKRNLIKLYDEAVEIATSKATVKFLEPKSKPSTVLVKSKSKRTKIVKPEPFSVTVNWD